MKDNRELSKSPELKSILFRTQLHCDTGEYITASGSPTVEEYGVKINDKTGAVDFVKTGELSNFQDMIDAAFKSVDIHCLIKRFQLGDTEVFNRRQGFYGDVTEMPRNMAEMFQRVHDCQAYFDSLSTDVKEAFNNSYTEYFSMMNDNPRAFSEVLAGLDDHLNIDDILEVDEEKGEDE